MTPLRSARRRPSGATAPLTADTCPLLASEVVFEKAGEGEVWIALVHGVPSSRVSRTVVELLTAMDGRTTLHVLHRRFAASESAESFLQLVGRFRDSGLLEGAAKPPPGRVSYRPPFTLQLATLRAPALFGRLDRLIVPLPPRVLLVSAAVVLGSGCLAAILQAEELWEVVTRPLPLSGFVVLVAALSLTTLLHESAHGLALTRFGGRPRRAGFMLFYLTPAFFVDVTDGWRLSDRRQRVAVALAGPAVHALVAAIALVGALAVPQPAVRQTLQLLALSCAVIVLLNLIPFVRFDGYIALMSALDEPNLRGRTIRDGADSLSRLLFGGLRRSRTLPVWWSVPFGLASLIAPAVLVLFAVARTVQALAGGGPVLGLFVVALEAVVLAAGVVLLARALRRVLRSGVSRLRFLSVCALLVAGGVAAGVLIPVPATASYGFSVEEDGVVLVRADGEGPAAVPDGARVVLLSRGILANEELGKGRTRHRRAERTTVPLDALFPVRADDLSVPAVIVAGVDVSGGREMLPATGLARVDIGVKNLWQTLWAVGVVAPLSPLRSAERKG